MDMNEWKLARPGDVPAGKPMIWRQALMLRLPPLPGTSQIHGMVMSGEETGRIVRVGNDHALHFTGKIEFGAAIPDLLTATVSVNGGRGGSLIVGTHELYVLGTLSDIHDTYMFGLSANGDLIGEEDILGERYAIVSRWQLMGLDSAGRSSCLAEISASLAS